MWEYSGPAMWECSVTCLLTFVYVLSTSMCDDSVSHPTPCAWHISYAEGIGCLRLPCPGIQVFAWRTIRIVAGQKLNMIKHASGQGKQADKTECNPDGIANHLMEQYLKDGWYEN